MLVCCINVMNILPSILMADGSGIKRNNTQPHDSIRECRQRCKEWCTTFSAELAQCRENQGKTTVKRQWSPRIMCSPWIHVHNCKKKKKTYSKGNTCTRFQFMRNAQIRRLLRLLCSLNRTTFFLRSDILFEKRFTSYSPHRSCVFREVRADRTNFHLRLYAFRASMKFNDYFFEPICIKVTADFDNARTLSKNVCVCVYRPS